MSRIAKVRPMEPDDVPQVARLFFAAFRKSRLSSFPDFETYLHDLIFTHPNYRAETGSLVSVNAEGRVQGAMSVLPMGYRVDDAPVTSRLLCTFMAAPDANPGGIAELTLSIRPKAGQICFSDSAAPVSVGHFRAIGGQPLPCQSLQWFKVFRPLAFAAGKVADRMPGRLRRLRRAMTVPSRPPAGESGQSGAKTPALTVEEIDAAGFSAQAALLLQDYRVAPTLLPAELEWIGRLSGNGRGHGGLRLLAARDGKGEIAGLFSMVGGMGGVAEVLDIFSRAGAQAAVIAAMLARLRAEGYVYATGRLRLDLIEGFSEQSGIWCRHGAHVYVASRLPGVREAMRTGGVHVGGTAGEGWSRLMRDFF